MMSMTTDEINQQIEIFMDDVEIQQNKKYLINDMSKNISYDYGEAEVEMHIKLEPKIQVERAYHKIRVVDTKNIKGNKLF